MNFIKRDFYIGVNMKRAIGVCFVCTMLHSTYLLGAEGIEGSMPRKKSVRRPTTTQSKGDTLPATPYEQQTKLA